MSNSWEKAQKWEKDWHGNCANSLNEEIKQLAYAERMGLKFVKDAKSPFNIDLKGKSILDIGGGAYSLLLKGFNFSKGENSFVRTSVIDPLNHPEWVKLRYASAGIFFKNMKGEDLRTEMETPKGSVPYTEGQKFDEVWIYNCLQHTEDPQKIIENAKKVGKLIRIFEWVGTPVNVGHLHTLKPEKLDEWLGGEGKVEFVNDRGAYGTAYYGVFPT